MATRPLLRLVPSLAQIRRKCLEFRGSRRSGLRSRPCRTYNRAMKISLIQMNTQERKDANLAQAERLIEAAIADDRPDMVLLPEMFTMLSEDLEAKRANAEILPSRDGANTPPGEA